jgi:hypothetical protein
MHEAVTRLGGDVASGLQPRDEDIAVIRSAIAGAKPMQVAQAFAALEAVGCMDLEIARITGRTLRNVQCLTLVHANEQTRALVSTGKISAALAYQAIKDSQLTAIALATTLQAVIVMDAKKKATRGSGQAGAYALAQLAAFNPSIAPQANPTFGPTKEHSSLRGATLGPLKIRESLRRLGSMLFAKTGGSWRAHFDSVNDWFGWTMGRVDPGHIYGISEQQGTACRTSEPHPSAGNQRRRTQETAPCALRHGLRLLHRPQGACPNFPILDSLRVWRCD